MNPKARWGWCLVAGMLATATFAQDLPDEGDDEGPRPQRATKVPTEGFWPTQRMMERIIDRITDKMAVHYDFDDAQLELTREMFRARFPTFLNENRAEIQTLLNQYFEAVLDDEPPAIEDVAIWAQRVQPLVGEFVEVCHEVTEGMREYLTDDQQVMLDAEVAAFQTGTRMIQNKLSVWSEGGYDPETEWIHPGPQRHRREREERREAQEAMDEARRQVLEEGADPEAAAAAATESAASTQPGRKTAGKTPKDEWTIYTEQFIARYELNVEQKQKAYAFLRRQQEERDKYLRQKAKDMERVTKLLKTATTEEERKAALGAYDRLTAPVERMFQQLKDRLDTLPTRAQRRAAARAGLEAESRPSTPTEEKAEPEKEQPQPEGTPEP